MRAAAGVRLGPGRRSALPCSALPWPPPRRCSVGAGFEIEERKVPPPPRLPRAAGERSAGRGAACGGGALSSGRSCQVSASMQACSPGAVLGVGPAHGSCRRPGDPRRGKHVGIFCSSLAVVIFAAEVT